MSLPCIAFYYPNKIYQLPWPLSDALANESNETLCGTRWLNGTTTETAYLNLTLCQPDTEKHLFGRLWGGNLTVLGHLAGTGYLPQMSGILLWKMWASVPTVLIGLSTRASAIF